MSGIMDILTSDGWQAVALIIGAIIVLPLAIEFAFDWRAGRKPLSRRTLLERVLDLMWPAMIMSIAFLPGSFESLGIPYWVVFVMPLPLVFGSMYLMSRKQKQLQQGSTPRINPNAKPGVDLKQAEKFSTEETKVNTRLVGLVAAIGVASVGLVVFLLPKVLSVDEGPNILGLSIMLAVTTAVLALLTFGAVGRWPGRMHMQASLIVERPVAEIWDALQYRTTTDWWNPIVQRIQALPGEGERYKMHYLCDDTCGECGLPRDPDVSTRAALIEVLNKRDQELLHVRAQLMGSPSVEGLMAYEETIRVLEPLSPTTTRVTSHSICVKPKMWMAVILRLGDPCGEELRTFKHLIEGTKADTLQAAAAARIAAHRQAERFCGCAHGAAIAGKFIT